MLVLGGTGFLGPDIVDSARASGWTLTLFNRGRTNPGLFLDLEQVHGDRNADLALLKDRRWDVVVDTSGYYPRQVKAAAAVLGGNVGQYVFVSTISVYSDTSQPGMDESAPVGRLEGPEPAKMAPEQYGPLKASCERAAEEAMPGRVTVVRPGLIVGPDDPTDRFTYWPARVARGGEVLCPGSPSDPVQFIDSRDLGAWIVRYCADRTLGVFNAVGPKPDCTMGRLLDACDEAGGGGARLTWADAGFLDEQQVAPWQDMPGWVPPFGDHAGFSRVSAERALSKGLAFRPVAETVKDTLAWWRTLPAERTATMRAGIDPEREKTVLAAWHAARAAGPVRPAEPAR
jgi:2'-hydroxyisoflavone reductase